MKYEMVCKARAFSCLSFFLFVFLFSGCQSVRTIVLDNGTGIEELGKSISELEDKQRADTGFTTTITSGLEELTVEIGTIADSLNGVGENIGDVIGELARRTKDYDEFERILDEVRKRKGELSDGTYTDTE